MNRKRYHRIEDLQAGDTVELTSGPDAGMRGIVDHVHAGKSAWVMVAADGEDTREIALADLKITHKFARSYYTP